MKKGFIGAAVIASVFAAGVAVRLLCSPFLPIEAEAPVFVPRRAGSMPEPVQVSPEDAGRIIEIITWNKLFCRNGTSDSAGYLIWTSVARNSTAMKTVVISTTTETTWKSRLPLAGRSCCKFR